MFDNIRKLDLNKTFNPERMLVIEPAVVDHCNLNCAYCDHMSPIAPPSFYDINQFDKDFKALSKVMKTDYIRSRYKLIVQLVGGEPFLHPQLMDFVDIIFKYMPVDYLSSFIIITNGTLFGKRMDMAERHRELLRRYHKPGIVISKYPAVNEDFIRKTYAEYIGSPDAPIFIEKRDTFNKVNLDFRTRDLSGYCSDNCMCLRDGKLFKCPISGNVNFLLDKLHSKSQVIEPEDYLDLTQEITPQELEDFHENPRNFCYYCKQRSNNLPWKRSEQNPKEWLNTTKKENINE